jgi:CheY-like chemotaxis protein
MVVEDNHDARESLCLLLSLSGYEVREAADGADGVRLALGWRPDAVISDIGLPGLDGWELARRLRAGLGRAVLLVALTGFANLNDRQRSLKAGFDAHLAKPAEPEDLLALLGPARRGGGAGAAVTAPAPAPGGVEAAHARRLE